MEIRDTFLMFVDIKDGVQSNKFYNMFPQGGNFKVEYGRVGNAPSTTSYSISQWRSKYNSKIKKGYKDITDLKQATVVVSSESSGNNAFEEFYSVFSKYTGKVVRSNYLVDGCTQQQIDKAQECLNDILKVKKVDDVNDLLKELYTVIPRRMGNLNNFLIRSMDQVDKFVAREQDAIDSIDSNNTIIKTNPFKELNVTFEECSKKDVEMLERLLYPTRGYKNVKIHKAYKVSNKLRTKEFKDFLKKQSNKECELLIHGTRNANVFGIMKSGLLIRPTNAAVISGAAYGNGVYHSAHTAKSLGYTGNDNDKLFFIQNVNMGKPFIYSGWYRDGKSLDRSKMNFKDLKALGYDSLFVQPGDGLLNSEYIVYDHNQTNTEYLVWMK